MKNYILNMAKDYSILFRMGAKWCKNYWLGLIVLYATVYGAAYGIVYYQNYKIKNR